MISNNDTSKRCLLPCNDSHRSNTLSYNEWGKRYTYTIHCLSKRHERTRENVHLVCPAHKRNEREMILQCTDKGRAYRMYPSSAVHDWHSLHNISFASQQVWTDCRSDGLSIGWMVGRTDNLNHVITRAPEVRLTLWLVHSAWFFKPRRLSMVSEPDSCQKAQF